MRKQVADGGHRPEPSHIGIPFQLLSPREWRAYSTSIRTVTLVLNGSDAVVTQNACQEGRAWSEPPKAAETCRPELNNMAGLGRRGNLDAAVLTYALI